MAEWGYPIIVQEVVTGDELNVVGLGDGNGEVLGMLGIRKLMTTSLGKIWTGVTVKNQRMLEAAEKLVQFCRWRGPFELECIADGDEIYLIEVNPRFPAWSYFATGVGINLPSRMLQHSCGVSTSFSTDYEAGKLFIRYTSELVTDMATFQHAMTRGETE